jgi:hypothetical protein
VVESKKTNGIDLKQYGYSDTARCAPTRSA